MFYILLTLLILYILIRPFSESGKHAALYLGIVVITVLYFLLAAALYVLGLATGATWIAWAMVIAFFVITLYCLPMPWDVVKSKRVGKQRGQK